MAKTELPLEPDDALLERLQRSVEFFEHAMSHVSGVTAIERMVAVHSLDNSVEYLLRIVLDAFDIEAKTGKNLDTVELASLASEVNAYFQAEYELRVPYRTEIKKLRKIRNLVQHGMLDPVGDLNHLATIVDRFYKFVFDSLFGTDPKDLRISQLIRDVGVRELLAKAEDAIDQGDYLKAIVAARDAFDNAFYNRRRSSNLRLNSIPVLLDEGGTFKNHFFAGLVDEVEQLRFGVDARDFRRFEEYVRHIPAEDRAEWQGNLVMQRPWKQEDAEFCYRFVAQTVIQWQNAELAPLYEKNLSELPDWIEHFAGVSIPQDSHSMSYDLGDDKDGQIEVFVVGEALKEALEDLPLGREYDHVSERLQDGEFEWRSFNRVELKNRLVRLLTHNPSRWEVILYVIPVPLTWYGQEFEDATLVKETPCINTASIDEIVDVYPDLITSEVAESVVRVREQQGRFRTRRDLEQVPGITAKQVDWLCRFTRAQPTAPLQLDQTPLEKG